MLGQVGSFAVCLGKLGNVWVKTGHARSIGSESSGLRHVKVTLVKIRSDQVKLGQSRSK